MNIFLYFLKDQPGASLPTRVIRATGKFFLLGITCIACLQSQSQQAKSVVQLGDQYFAAGEYYTAANFYGQYLHPSKKQRSASNFPLNIKANRGSVPAANVSRTDILFKQAESYRLANYWQYAATSYKECIEKDPSQYPAALYWYGVCERSLGHYDTASENFNQYISSVGDSDPFKGAAQKELQTLLYIKKQMARPDSVLTKTQKLSAPGSFEKGVFAPAHISGDQFLVSSTQPDTLTINGVNPYHSHLYYATLNNDNLDGMIPVNLSTPGPVMNQGAASVSANGNYLYFSQWKKENGQTISSIYSTVKQGDGWSAPTLLSSVNIQGYNSKQPFCTSDGKFLFFASDRPGGSGKFDIWYAPLNNDGTTGEPVNLGSTINTSDDEQAPFYQTSSATLVFSSNGHAGMGGYDLFEAVGVKTTWSSPENIGYPVNSSRDDIYFFAPEKTSLLGNAIFSSDRGEGCCLETYNIKRAPKSKRLTGVLRDCSDNTPLSDASITLKDVSGKTWKASTDANGRYSFDIGNENSENLVITAHKQLYQDTISTSQIEKVDESDLLTDKFTNAIICIQKIPEPKPVAVLVIKAEDVVTVYFDFDKSVLKPEAISRLDSIYNILTANTGATIQISGYTDGLGSDAYNKVLSDKRARSCANYLIQKGIEAGRVSFVSFGACCPVEMEKINGRDNPDGRSRNRRALINVKKD